MMIDNSLIVQNKTLIEEHLLKIRGQQVILDSSLATLYGVTTKRLNEQVKRNLARFPSDFMFQITKEEKAEVVAKCDHLSQLKFSRTTPFAFTEHGVIMVASILSSAQAIEVSVLVVRAFVKLRQILASNKELTYKITELERRLDGHDETIQSLIDGINQLIAPPEPIKKRKIGFVNWED